MEKHLRLAQTAQDMERPRERKSLPASAKGKKLSTDSKPDTS